MVFSAPIASHACELEGLRASPNSHIEVMPWRWEAARHMADELTAEPRRRR